MSSSSMCKYVQACHLRIEKVITWLNTQLMVVPGKFQAHCARITSKESVPFVLRTLKQNKKIANATHNIWAFRIRTSTGKLVWTAVV